MVPQLQYLSVTTRQSTRGSARPEIVDTKTRLSAWPARAGAASRIWMRRSVERAHGRLRQDGRAGAMARASRACCWPPENSRVPRAHRGFEPDRLQQFVTRRGVASREQTSGSRMIDSDGLRGRGAQRVLRRLRLAPTIEARAVGRARSAYPDGPPSVPRSGRGGCGPASTCPIRFTEDEEAAPRLDRQIDAAERVARGSGPEQRRARNDYDRGSAARQWLGACRHS